MRTIVHITSAHPRFDVRIFFKHCKSFECMGFNTHLLVADGKGEEQVGKILIHDVGKPINRVERVLKIPNRMLKKAIELDADIYILHDPELLQIALKLKNLKRKVVFDSHENYSKQILGKQYINKFIRFILSYIFSIYERFVSKRIDAVIAATPSIRDYFLSFGIKSLDINNYPLLSEIDLNASSNWDNKSNEVCYIGGIASSRGIIELVDSLSLTSAEVKLNLCGEFSESSTQLCCQKKTGWNRVNYFGLLSRKELFPLINQSIAGIVTFHPSPNHLDSQPNKMFEYMANGMPIIASNFPLWERIIKENKCGLIVDPLSSLDIAKAIDFLVANREIAKQMGTNGKHAIIEKYNWDVEEKKLINFIEQI
ncbi:MAG: glycosyltransferase [Sediminibacterium sp.]|jgi:glycosyltransferase involved in cell wall biosynthesis|uniref:glycosyltransferase n=1 Tax=Sediminibacterium sp. TaxID=1917865 RepID=UPI002ABBA2B8|nr:glycosyltransferase [Sediminibacterium sp.]MDZ4070731.1 glycosyltransferase [Sediminibacterium sp.]